MRRRAEDHGYEHMDLDDFEQLLGDKPAQEKSELIDGRVVRMLREVYRRALAAAS